MKAALAELEKILADICEKTGAEATLSPRGGGETRFALAYRGEEVPAYLRGTGEYAEREARLIAYLVENVDSHTLIPAKEEALRTILLGEGGGWYAFRFMTKFNLADGTCVAVDVVPDKRLAESYAQLERTLSESQDMVVRMDDNRVAVVHFAVSPLENVYLRFVCKIILVAILYAGTLYVLRSTLLRETLDYLKRMIHKQKT